MITFQITIDQAVYNITVDWMPTVSQGTSISMSSFYNMGQIITVELPEIQIFIVITRSHQANHVHYVSSDSESGYDDN